MSFLLTSTGCVVLAVNLLSFFFFYFTLATDLSNVLYMCMCVYARERVSI